jgi:CheY-like chemotaxis protein
MNLHQEHRILIVDDSFRNLNLMQQLLKSWGYSESTVSSKEEALSRLSHDTFDLIVVDKVKGMKELQLATLIREIQPTTPVICSGEEAVNLPEIKEKPVFRPFQKLKTLFKQAVENGESYSIILI